MPRPFLKICGLRRLADLVYVLDQEVRYVGMITEVPASPRSLSLPAAVRLARHACGRAVAVVRDLPEARLHAIIEALEPTAVQLHGQERPELVAALRKAFPEVEVWRALGVPPEVDDREAEIDRLRDEAELYSQAGAGKLLLDTRLPAGSGGTGTCCDWQVAAELVRSLAVPVILAGGLRPDNLVAAAAAVAPAGLDVSSGVEAAPGVKSLEKLEKLFAQWKTIA